MNTKDGHSHGRPPAPPYGSASIVVPLKLRTEVGDLAFISTTTIFGTPVDVTVAELAIESFFPAMQRPLKRYDGLEGHK